MPVRSASRTPPFIPLQEQHQKLSWTLDCRSSPKYDNGFARNGHLEEEEKYYLQVRPAASPSTTKDRSESVITGLRLIGNTGAIDIRVVKSLVGCSDSWVNSAIVIWLCSWKRSALDLSSTRAIVTDYVAIIRKFSAPRLVSA
jgi:hypothetical protein